MRKPFAIVFAGVPGSSKSIVAHYLSIKFGLPILSNDSLRYEVKEDMLIENLVLKDDLIAHGINVPEALAEYEKRLKKCREEALSTGRPVILDGSVDRQWPEIKQQLIAHSYSWFMINMELSKPFLQNLFSATGRDNFIPQLDNYFKQHQNFLEGYGQDVNLQITDENFKQRLKITADSLQKFMEMNN